MDARLIGVAVGRGLVRPVSAARATDALGWRGSLMVHLGAVAMLAAIAVLGTVAMGAAGLGPMDPRMEEVAMRWGPAGWLAMLPVAIADGMGETDPPWSLLLPLLPVAVLEGNVLFWAVLLWGWAARPEERVRASLARSVQRVWRLTITLVTLAVVMSAMHVVTWEVIDYVSAGLLSDDRITRWTDAQYELRRGWRDVWSAVIACIWILVVLAWLLVLIAGVRPGGRRSGWGARCRWPAVCEGCGYSLLGVSRTRDCPECGVALEDSLGEHVRPGTPWGRASSAWSPGGLWAWCRTMWRGITGPRRLGWAMRVLDDRPDRAVAGLVLGMVLVAAVGAVGGILSWVMLILSIDSRYGFPEHLWGWSMFVMIPLRGGLSTFSMSLLLVLLVSGPVAAVASAVLGRNVMPAAAEAGAVMTGWLAMLWTVMFLLSSIFGGIRIWLGRDYFTPQWYPLQLALNWTQMGIFLLGIVIGVWLQLRIAAGTRYANW